MNGETREFPAYVQLGRLWKRGEISAVCREALTDEGPLDTRELAVRVIRAKGLDEGDKVLRQTETLPADLVVDASGRAGLTLAFLERIGSPRPDVIEIGIDMGYATAIFEIPGDAPTEWTGVVHLPAPSDMSRGGFILPMEDGRWIVSLGERHGEGMPGDLDGFIALTKTFRTPTIHDAIRNAKPLGDIARYNLPASVRRRFDKLDRFPRGLIPLGIRSAGSTRCSDRA